MIILFLLIYIYLEIKIRRSKLIQENESLLFKKEKEIVDRKVKIEGLQRKLNESFTEVVEMAKRILRCFGLVSEKFILNFMKNAHR